MTRIVVTGRIWRFAYCEYDESKRQLWVRGRPATLQYKPLEVLLALLKATDHTLSKDQLLGQVWEGEADNPSLKTAAQPFARCLRRSGSGFHYSDNPRVRLPDCGSGARARER